LEVCFLITLLFEIYNLKGYSDLKSYDLSSGLQILNSGDNKQLLL
jgi:hypothetical protein